MERQISTATPAFTPRRAHRELTLGERASVCVAGQGETKGCTDLPRPLRR